MNSTKLQSWQNSIITILPLVLLFLISINSIQAQNSNRECHIKGSIMLDSIWEPTIYLSHISTFNKMHTMSKNMIVSKSTIDTLGQFSFTIDYLPKEDQLYRLHISKKDAPEASLIIGGKEENHFFIIANNTSKITITNRDSTLNTISIKGSKQNQYLKEINGIVNFIDSTSFNDTPIKSEFITEALNEKLKRIADTSNCPLIALYALNKSKFDINTPNNKQFHKLFLKKWENENSTYFKDFRQQFPLKTNSNIITYILLGILFFSFGVAFNHLYNSRFKKKGNKLKLLSIQERKIFTLLKEGKSNKDISEACNIGISTVKSHVSSIYNKLDIKSRKEVLDIDL